MKFLTYLAEKNKQPSFGFKLNDLIIDIRRSAEWINKDQGNEKFLTIPNDLKSTISDWNHFFPILQEMEEIVKSCDLSEISNADRFETFFSGINLSAFGFGVFSV